jgi:hypothetical protein
LKPSAPRVHGLHATPDQRTFGFFQENVVAEHSDEQSVADGVNVDLDRLMRVSSSASHAKQRFVLIDAVGVEKSLTKNCTIASAARPSCSPPTLGLPPQRPASHRLHPRAN